MWYWLSFADEKLPPGDQFLGAAIVYAHGIITPTGRAWELGINPGGECQCIGLHTIVAPRSLPIVC